MAYTLLTGTTVYPAQVSYQLINLTGDITLSWPSSFTSSVVAAGYNDVSPNTDTPTKHIIILPDATLGAIGSDTIFSNVSVYEFDIHTNDGVFLHTVNPGEIVDFKLYNNSTNAGLWRIIPFGGGYNGIVSFTAQSTDNTIVITNGAVSPPGATINFQLPTSIKNLNNVATTGFPVIKTTAPLTWGTVQLVAGTNIAITDPDGINASPIINLNDNVAGLASLQVGSIEMIGSEITTTATNGSVVITSDGNGFVIINDVTIDTNGKMVINGELDVTGTFISPFTPKAWCTFTDILNVTVHDITVQAQANVSSVEFVSTGNYKINFTAALSSINYGVIITLGTTGGPTPFVSHGFWTVREVGYVTISIVDASGQLVASTPQGVTVMIMSL
jgi:hypothetical protein